MQEYPQIMTGEDAEIFALLRRIVDLRREDVAEISELQRLRGYQSGFAHSTRTVTANYSIGVADLYVDGDATSGAITLTLPASPVDGETHWIAKTDASVNAVTVSGNGKNINGSATLAISTRYVTKRLVYMGGSGEWRAA